MRRTALLMLSLAVAAGCASVPEIRYFTLDMSPSGEVEPAVNVAVERLRTAEALARKDILIKKSPTEIEYYAQDQWAATLTEIVTEKLSAEFAPPKEGRPSISITGTILGFEQVDVPSGAEARVKLDLAFQKNHRSDPLLEKVYEVSLPAEAKKASAVVLALSACLEQLAVQIVADAAQLELE